MSFATEKASAANIALPAQSTGAPARRSGALASRLRRTSSATVNTESTTPTARWPCRIASARRSLRVISNAFGGHSAQSCVCESANSSQTSSTTVTIRTAAAMSARSSLLRSRPLGNESTR
ncbi:MAG TPA: hypothetical protein VF101_02985 [Gaiellaceae bacterium]